MTWREALMHKSFVIQLNFFLVSLVLVIYFLPHYFHAVIGPKPGVMLNDPVLTYFAPQDHSWIIFGLIYLSLITVLHGLWRKPLFILLGLKCYLAITLLRMITMYIVTMEPPAGMIPLHDPIVDAIAYGGVVFGKDLFFSGHVATLTLFLLLEDRPFYKKILIITTTVVSGLLLLQRVHYTIDVLVAPLMMIAVFYLLKMNFFNPIKKG